MKWKKGLFRLWVVLSAFWIIGIFLTLKPNEPYQAFRVAQEALGDHDGLYSVDSFLRAAENAEVAQDMPAAQRLRDFAESMSDHPEQMWKSRERKNLEAAQKKLELFVSLTFIPIGLAFAAGAALLWAICGFKRKNL